MALPPADNPPEKPAKDLRKLPPSPPRNTQPKPVIGPKQPVPSPKKIQAANSASLFHSYAKQSTNEIDKNLHLDRKLAAACNPDSSIMTTVIDNKRYAQLGDYVIPLDEIESVEGAWELDPLEVDAIMSSQLSSLKSARRPTAEYEAFLADISRPETSSQPVKHEGFTIQGDYLIEDEELTPQPSTSSQSRSGQSARTSAIPGDYPVLDFGIQSSTSRETRKKSTSSSTSKGTRSRTAEYEAFFADICRFETSSQAVKPKGFTIQGDYLIEDDELTPQSSTPCQSRSGQSARTQLSISREMRKRVRQFTTGHKEGVSPSKRPTLKVQRVAPFSRPKGTFFDAKDEEREPFIRPRAPSPPRNKKKGPKTPPPFKRSRFAELPPEERFGIVPFPNFYARKKKIRGSYTTSKVCHKCTNNDKQERCSNCHQFQPICRLCPICSRFRHFACFVDSCYNPSYWLDWICRYCSSEYTGEKEMLRQEKEFDKEASERSKKIYERLANLPPPKALEVEEQKGEVAVESMEAEEPLEMDRSVKENVSPNVSIKGRRSNDGTQNRSPRAPLGALEPCPSTSGTRQETSGQPLNLTKESPHSNLSQISNFDTNIKEANEKINRFRNCVPILENLDFEGYGWCKNCLKQMPIKRSCFNCSEYATVNVCTTAAGCWAHPNYDRRMDIFWYCEHCREELKMPRVLLENFCYSCIQPMPVDRDCIICKRNFRFRCNYPPKCLKMNYPEEMGDDRWFCCKTCLNSDHYVPSRRAMLQMPKLRVKLTEYACDTLTALIRKKKSSRSEEEESSHLRAVVIKLVK